MRFFWKCFGISFFPVFCMATAQVLPDTELPPDTTPSTSDVIWKGYTFSVPSTTAIPSSQTGNLVITPSITTVDLSPVQGSSTNYITQGYAEVNLLSKQWVRLYAQTPTVELLSDNGVPSDFINNDFLLYSKEATGGPNTVNGWYIGPGYNNSGTPLQFGTVSGQTVLGSFVTTIVPSSSDVVITGTEVDRFTDNQNQFVLISSATSTPSLSTFTWTPYISGSQVIAGALESGTMFTNLLGENVLLLSQASQYLDPGLGTLNPAVNNQVNISSLYSGTGAYNRDPHSTIYETYGAAPSLQVNSTRSLQNSSYYQYVNTAEVTGATLYIPQGTLLELTGDLIFSSGNIMSSTGTGLSVVLFSGEDNSTLTLDPSSTFTPDLLAVEITTLFLDSSNTDSVTIAPGSFDIISGSTINVGTNVILQTTPGTVWHGVNGSQTIPAIPYDAAIIGFGSVYFTSPLSTSSPGLWQNAGGINLSRLTLEADTIDTYLANTGYMLISNLEIASSSYAYYLDTQVGTCAISSRMRVDGSLTLTGEMTFFGNSDVYVTGNITIPSGTLFSPPTLILDNTATSDVAINSFGSSSIGTLELIGGGSDLYGIIAGNALTVTTINQGSDAAVADAAIVGEGSGTNLNIGTWQVQGPVDSITTLKIATPVYVTDMVVSQTELFVTTLSGQMGSLSITGDCTLEAGAEITWDSGVIMSLGSSVTCEEGAFIRGETGTTLQLGSLVLNEAVIEADTISFSSPSGCQGTGTITGTSEIVIQTNAVVAMTSEIVLSTPGTLSIQGVLSTPGTIVADLLDVVSGGSLTIGSTSTDITTVTGEVSLADYSVYTTYITPSDQATDISASRMNVLGDVTLGGHLVLNNANGNVHYGDKYVLMQASSFTGAFETVEFENDLNPGYTYSLSIGGDPLLFITISTTVDMTEGAGCGNTLDTARAFQSITTDFCGNEDLTTFIGYDLIPALLADTVSPSTIYSKLSGAEYAAIPETWNETQLQSLLPWNQWLWQEECAKEGDKHETLVAVMAGGLKGGNAHCGMAKWSAVNASGAVGLSKWHWGRNSLIIGIQNEWLGSHVSNAAHGRFYMNTFEGVAALSLYGSEKNSTFYGSFLLGGGGGFGHLDRDVHFNTFSNRPKGGFSLATWKGQLEMGAHLQGGNLKGQIYGTIQDVGTIRSPIKEDNSVIKLRMKRSAFSTVRGGVGGRIAASYGNLTPSLEFLGYLQHQTNGKKISMQLANASCGAYSQRSYGLSPLGATVSGDLRWCNQKGLSFDVLLASDLSSHVITYGGKIEMGFSW